jgi:hypothetical protein
MGTTRLNGQHEDVHNILFHSPFMEFLFSTGVRNRAYPQALNQIKRNYVETRNREKIHHFPHFIDINSRTRRNFISIVLYRRSIYLSLHKRVLPKDTSNTSS